MKGIVSTASQSSLMQRSECHRDGQIRGMYSIAQVFERSPDIEMDSGGVAVTLL